MAEATKDRPRFFDGDARPAVAVPLNEPRALLAAAEIMDLTKRVDKTRQRTLAWQEAAWNYYDQIGELKYAFNLISQIVSRAMIYAALAEDSSEVPVDAKAFLEELPDDRSGSKTKTARACEIADQGIQELVAGGQAEMLRLLSLNLSIPGECYLVDNHGKFTVASTAELVPGTPYKLNRNRTGNNAATGGTSSGSLAGVPLEKNAYCARVWRSHPRWYNEADSSMLGVLDQAEKIVLFDQVMRTISRQRLNAGVIALPAGLTPANGKTLEDAVNEATMRPVENEAVAFNVTPLVLTGPPEALAAIKRIDLARPLDDQLIQASESAIDRMLAGLDIPKNIVSGLADTRYSNALIIDDSLYKAHIEPMVLMICDAITTAYLHPYLRKKGVDEAMIQRLVVWYNPAQIVTRPDRSQAANEGYDRYLLSGEAWRRARGYSDLDKPDEDELIKRLAMEKVQIPQEVGTVMLEALNPEFFAKQRKENQQAAGVPPEVQQLLDTGTPPAPGRTAAPAGESTQTTNDYSGGEVGGNGSQPPRSDAAR